MQLLINYYYNYFMDDTKDGYNLLCSSVCLIILNGLYNRFVMDSIKPIEILDEEQKKRYLEQAKRFYTDKDKRIKAMKAAYTLESITGKGITND